MSIAAEEQVLILDFGSQYAQLIARRVREMNVFCRIVPHGITSDEMRKIGPKGIILSGGPSSVYSPGAPRCDEGIFQLDVPILGICYGMQLGCLVLGGDVQPAPSREYGGCKCVIDDHSDLFRSLPDDITVWMSHGDCVTELGEDFVSLAHTGNCAYTAARHVSAKFYGVQFHPEVTHTPRGSDILHNFLYEICGCSGSWQIESFLKQTVEDIRNQVGEARVVCGLSGGVDSSVVAAIIHRAVGDQLCCIFVDNGVQRSGEADKVSKTFKEHFAFDLHVVDAREQFLKKLAGVVDPEEKRKIIGHEFIAVFKEEAKQIDNAKFLAQGTLYPDVIESMSAHGGPSAVIKSHHNVGGLPKELGFELVEPLRDLFKDEVRRIGLELGLPEEMVWRQPFPGPGLAVRILGPVTADRVETLQAADGVVLEEIRAAGLYRAYWQSFAVLLPISTVGVMGDDRTYESVVAIRIVESTDGMTADWAHVPYEVLENISNRIINEVRGVNRVVYDISSKPPSTIEWE